jgi:serine/threonine protein kinase
LASAASIRQAPEGSGKWLGKYEILRQIAAGGMAEIHLARATGIEGFEKLVVVKRILPHLCNNAEFVQMFLDEARIAATLHHSNIVQVYDIGSIDRSFFFAMEFLHGEDVTKIMKTLIKLQRPLPLEHALAMILGACSGLHYAHEKKASDGTPLNLVHRDVSPQNVFVTYDGGVKVVDFGIAKAAHRITETRQGTLKGKIPYMSPEQCQSQKLDKRSDVFALAVMLWELTTMTRLYRAESEFETMKMICEQPARLPSSVRPDYPKGLEAIVMKGLARDREERYQSAQEMALAIEDFAREHRLAVSTIRLEQFMKELFGEKISAFNEASEHGQLTQHVVEALDKKRMRSDPSGQVVLPPGELTPQLSDRIASHTELRAPRPPRWAKIASACASALMLVLVVVSVRGYRSASAKKTETVAIAAPSVVAPRPTPVAVAPPPVTTAPVVKTEPVAETPKPTPVVRKKTTPKKKPVESVGDIDSPLP